MSQKKNIIVDLERMRTPNTGLYVYCLNLCLHLEKINHPFLNFHFYADRKTEIPIPLKKINRNSFHKLINIPSSNFKIWHCTFQGSHYIPQNKIKKIYTIHDLNFLYTDKPSSRKRKLLQDVQRKVASADIVTTISHYVKSDITRNIDVESSKIKVIHNGVSLKKPITETPPKYHPKGEFIFTIGTIQRKKNFHVLPKLLVENRLELIIAGIPNIDYVHKIKQTAKDYGVEDRVHIVNIITEDEKYWYLSHCKAFAFPSLSEGFGIPVIEAMLLGKPTLLSKMTSLPEIGGKHAYYFDDFEAQSMQDTLHYALQDYSKNQKKPQIMDWAKQFSWEKSTAEYVKIYEELSNIE